MERELGRDGEGAGNKKVRRRAAFYTTGLEPTRVLHVDRVLRSSVKYELGMRKQNDPERTRRLSQDTRINAKRSKR